MCPSGPAAAGVIIGLGAKSGRFDRSMEVNRLTIERSAARAMGFTR